MRYFPISLDLTGRLCLVIGGGRVAERKVRALLSCGGLIRVVSPELTTGLNDLLRERQIEWFSRPYQEGDLEAAFLVIAATDDVKAQTAIQAEAEQRQVLLNVVDVPQRCNFILPATTRRGDLTISVSTAGKSPALAKKLRQELEERFGPEYEILLNILGRLRPQVLALGLPQRQNKERFENLVRHDMLGWIAARDEEKIAHCIKTVINPDLELDWLAAELQGRPQR